MNAVLGISCRITFLGLGSAFAALDRLDFADLLAVLVNEFDRERIVILRFDRENLLDVRKVRIPTVKDLGNFAVGVSLGVVRRSRCIFALGNYLCIKFCSVVVVESNLERL